MIISRSPYRISFLGGGTDYNGWIKLHGGCCLSTTIDKYCYVLVKEITNFIGIRYKIVYRKIEMVGSLDDIEHSTARECIRYSGIDIPLEVHHYGDLPARSGVGSSSAYAVSLLNSLYVMKNKFASKRQLAEDAIYVEQKLLGQQVGLQDQIACAYGGLNKIEFLKSGNFNVFPIPINKERIDEFQNHLLLFYLGMDRTASDVASTFVPNIDSKRRQLRVSQDLVNEGIDVLCSNKDIKLFGELLHEYWMIKKTLSDIVSSESIDGLYQIAIDNGAIGGKITGAGAGGMMLLFAEPKNHGRIINSLSGLVHVPFRFEFNGTTTIFYER
jgi:D-glycero-alpha-D-manno-heptose-7-phosphate kinase